MKRFFTAIALLLILLPVSADNREVYIDTDTNNKPRPRSLIQKPTVFVDDVLNTLSVKFTSQGEVYTITITDGTGFTIAQFQTASDYGQQVYSLPELIDGSYNITIEGSSNSFTGSFDI